MAQPGPLSPVQQLCSSSVYSMYTSLCGQTGKQMTNKGSKPTSFWVRATLPHARFGSLGVLLPTPGPCHLSAFFLDFPSLLPAPSPSTRGLIGLDGTRPGNRVAISQRALGLSGSFYDMSKPGREEKRLVRRWRAMFDLKHRRHGRDRVALVLGSCAGGLIPAGLDLKGPLDCYE